MPVLKRTGIEMGAVAGMVLVGLGAIGICTWAEASLPRALAVVSLDEPPAADKDKKIPSVQQIQQEISDLSAVEKPECERLLQAAEMALRGHAVRREGWDRLLTQAASFISMGGCDGAAEGWFTLLASDSEDPMVRSDAYLWLGALKKQGSPPDLHEALRCFDQSLAALDQAGVRDAQSHNRVEVMFWKSDVFSSLGMHQEAATLHAQGIELLEAKSKAAKEEPSQIVSLMSVQAGLEYKAGNAEAACRWFDRILERPAPVTEHEIGQRLHAAIVRHQTGRKTDDPDGGLPALEAAWAEPAFRDHPEVTVVGWHLLEARRLAKRPWSERAALAAEIIHLVNQRQEAWLERSASPVTRVMLKDKLDGAKMTAASFLQSYTIHGRRDLLDLAYESILELKTDPTERDRVVKQWAREVRNLEAFLATNPTLP